MSGIGLEIGLVLLLILANGLLAMAEIAVVSARKARLQQRANEGDEKAQAALELANDPADFLSTVQMGITLVGVLAGAFGGAAIAAPLAEQLNRIELLRPYSRALALSLVVLVITYLSLVIGELAPKRLALNNPERIAAAVAPLMRQMAQIASPFVRLLSFSTDVVLRLFGVRPSNEPPVTEEEIRVLIEQGTEAGVFEEAEQDMVAGIFRLSDRRIGTLMVPRREIVWLDLEDPVEVNRRKIIESVHSRFPVALGGLDDIRGIVQAKDLLADCLSGQPLDLQSAMIEPTFAPEAMPALQVLDIFKETRVHIALVIDEFGSLQGLVTINDILEAIVGDLPLAGELLEPEAIRREDGSWLLDGMLPIDEFIDLLQIRRLPENERGYYQTLAGFVVTQLGRIPTSGDHFEWNGLRFEVVDMDGLRVDKVMVAPGQ